ncbi:MAG: dihydroneopterin aldolase, partial [Hyphomicrobiales bacterium]|nr:dihydroneopterin aldolase [Hyphomicrobiales bacterium]
MTLFLASVTSETEAEIAIASGADIIDFKDPAKGALGALEPERLRSAVASVSGRRPTSAVTGDLPMDPQTLPLAVENIAAIGVVFADETVDLSLVERLAAARFHGAMIDTARKGAGRLLNRRDLVWLSAFVERCRRNGILAGLAGSLEPPDVPRLLPLRPDILGFRGALCAKGERTAELDPKAISLVRELIPSDRRAQAAGNGQDGDRVDYRLLVGRGYAVEPRDGASRADRIFVRDFVVPMHIGAY